MSVEKINQAYHDELGEAKSRSWPHVSNDKPGSEAQFETLNYRPDYPDRIGSLIDARSWSRRFFAWYNEQHNHTELELLTPDAIHSGRAETILEQHQAVVEQVFQAHPERFVCCTPQKGKLSESLVINPPSRQQTNRHLLRTCWRSQLSPPKLVFLRLPLCHPYLILRQAERRSVQYWTATRVVTWLTT